jgi:hypothetical protein
MFSNRSLEDATLKKLNRTAYDRAKHLLDVWGVDELPLRVNQASRKPGIDRVIPSTRIKSTK